MKTIINLQTTDVDIVLAPESETILIEKLDSEYSCPKRHFHLGTEARAQYVLIIDGEVTFEAYSRIWQQAEKSNLNTYYLFLNKQPGEWQLKHELAEQATINSRSLYIGVNESDLKVKADYDFSGRGSFGRVSVDILLSNHAQVKYEANLNVFSDAQKSDTRVDMRLRLNGKDVRGQIVPGLNIAANDVKAGHSASTFQLSPEDLFYLRCRGLSPEAIRKMLALSLSRGFIKGIDDSDMANEILLLIGKSI